MGGVGAFGWGRGRPLPAGHGLGRPGGVVRAVGGRRGLQGVTVAAGGPVIALGLAGVQAVWGEVLIQATVVLLYPRAHVALRLGRQDGVAEAQHFVGHLVEVLALLSHLPLLLHDALQVVEERARRRHLVAGAVQATGVAEAGGV